MKRFCIYNTGELGVFFSPSTLAKMAPSGAGVGSSDIRIVPYPDINRNAIINIDGEDDDEDDDDEGESPKVVVPLAFDLIPVPYDKNDIPWACNRPCSIPDAFGVTLG